MCLASTPHRTCVATVYRISGQERARLDCGLAYGTKDFTDLISYLVGVAVEVVAAAALGIGAHWDEIRGYHAAARRL